MIKMRKMDPCDWFCDPGSHICTQRFSRPLPVGLPFEAVAGGNNPPQVEDGTPAGWHIGVLQGNLPWP